MDESRDPMTLWVGDWKPDDVIDLETRRLKRPTPDEHPRPEGAPAEREAR